MSNLKLYGRLAAYYKQEGNYAVDNEKGTRDMKYKELTIGRGAGDSFDPHTELFRSCMRSFFRDTAKGCDPTFITETYGERIEALRKVKDHQAVAAASDIENRRSKAESEIFLEKTGESLKVPGETVPF